MASKPILAMIVAMAKNRAIGINNQLPWHISEDLKYFKATTMGKPIIMGRKTYESIGRPLPGRQNIVVTRQTNWKVDGVDVASSPEQAIELAANSACEEVFVIGGAELYRHALPLAHRLYVTEVAENVEGDAYFPEIPLTLWQEESRKAGENCADAGLNYDFVVFKKVD